MRYRYGIFPEVGFQNDPMYPEKYFLGPEEVENEGCNTTLKFFNRPHSNSSTTRINRQMVSFQLFPIFTSKEFEKDEIQVYIDVGEIFDSKFAKSIKI